MLIFKKIVIENFGPYKKMNTIEFPQEDGITIVYGENMKGKTSLLNAFRYALFGKVLGRASKEISLHKISNWENAEEGIYGFKVELYFSYNSDEYRLTRQHVLREGVTIPQSDLDYSSEYYLTKNGDVLSPNERDRELMKIMPEQVSRFFLFDGELLQEYEELLNDESAMGKKITEAIEMILGVPILTNARADIRKLLEIAEKIESRELVKNQETRELGIFLNNLTDRRSQHSKEIDRLKQQLKKQREIKLDIEEELRKMERYDSLLNDKDDIERKITESNEKLKEKQEKLQELLSDSWKYALSGKIEKIMEDINNEINTIQQAKAKAQAREEIVKNAIKALEKGNCPTCLQDLSDIAKQRLEEIVKIEPSVENIDEGRLAYLQQKFARLKNIDLTNNIDLLNMIQNDISDLIVDIANLEDKLQETMDQLSGIDPNLVRTKRNDYDKVIKDITLIEQAINEETIELQQVNERIKEIQKKLDMNSDATFERVRKRRELYEKLLNLFEEGVKIYREKLKSKVEKDASDLFVKLTSEKEYKGLKINENYGLTIIHESGNTIPIRSAGAEHVVALSLIGALQKNTPLRGPIIMDSPFGRLDDNHTINIVRALPYMARQVILLVYERELNPNLARNELLGKLKQEYKIEGITARHSKIKKI